LNQYSYKEGKNGWWVILEPYKIIEDGLVCGVVHAFATSKEYATYYCNKMNGDNR